MDLHQLIDETIEQPGPLRLDDHLRAGRRAVRRRRLPAVLGAGGALVAAVAVVAAITGPGGEGRAGVPASDPASDPSVAGVVADPSNPSQCPSTPPPFGWDPPGDEVFSCGYEVTPGRGWEWDHPSGVAAEYDLRGELEVRPDWRVVERVQRPITAPVEANGPGTERVPDASVGLAVTDGETTQWVLTWYDAVEVTSDSTFQVDDEGPASSLRDFVDRSVARETDGAGRGR